MNKIKVIIELCDSEKNIPTHIVINYNLCKFTRIRKLKNKFVVEYNYKKKRWI